MDRTVSFEEIAEQIGGQVEKEEGILPRPWTFPLEVLHDAPENPVHLLSWGIFNPFGPTLAGLSAIPLSSEEALLIYDMHNPFQTWASVLGLTRMTEEGVPSKALEVLFGRGGPGDHPLFLDLPTHLIHAENVPEGRPTGIAEMGPDLARELMWIATRALEVPENELRWLADSLETFRRDPWGWAHASLDKAFADPQIIRTIERITGRTVPPLTSRSPGPAATAVEGPAERSTFDRWFDAVTHPEHVRSEVEEIPAAWLGAIRFLTHDRR